MKEKHSFNILDRIKSIRYAVSGIGAFFRREHNAWLHAIATVAVVVLAVIYPVTVMEGCVLIIVTGLVWFAEIFNTAIERMMDLLHPSHHPEAGRIKDLSAGAVLVLAVVACCTGLIIFIPKIC